MAATSAYALRKARAIAAGSTPYQLRKASALARGRTVQQARGHAVQAGQSEASVRRARTEERYGATPAELTRVNKLPVAVRRRFSRDDALKLIRGKVPVEQMETAASARARYAANGSKFGPEYAGLVADMPPELAHYHVPEPAPWGG
jgi:hypothetical protein